MIRDTYLLRHHGFGDSQQSLTFSNPCKNDGYNYGAHPPSNQNPIVSSPAASTTTCNYITTRFTFSALANRANSPSLAACLFTQYLLGKTPEVLNQDFILNLSLTLQRQCRLHRDGDEVVPEGHRYAQSLTRTICCLVFAF